MSENGNGKHERTVLHAKKTCSYLFNPSPPIMLSFQTQPGLYAKARLNADGLSVRSEFAVNEPGTEDKNLALTPLTLGCCYISAQLNSNIYFVPTECSYTALGSH